MWTAVGTVIFETIKINLCCSDQRYLYVVSINENIQQLRSSRIKYNCARIIKVRTSLRELSSCTYYVRSTQAKVDSCFTKRTAWFQDSAISFTSLLPRNSIVQQEQLWILIASPLPGSYAFFYFVGFLSPGKFLGRIIKYTYFLLNPLILVVNYHLCVFYEAT